MQRLVFLYFGLTLVLLETVSASEGGEGKKSLPESSDEESMPRFDSTVGEMVAKSAAGLETLKKWSEDAKSNSGLGMDFLKGFSGGLGDRFGTAKDKFDEASVKMKETIGDAALNVKEEVETAASKVSNHAKEAKDTMLKMIG